MADRVGAVGISSRVATGAVGNALVEAAFARLAPRVPLALVDSVTWSAPGNHPRRTGPTAEPAAVRAALDLLLEDRQPALFLSGYLRTAGQVHAVAGGLDAHADPARVYLLDPVLGDQGELYVDRETAEAVRDLLLPRAQVMVPNETEARWLAGDEAGALPLAEVVARLVGRAPGLAALVITGVPAGDDGLAMITWERTTGAVGGLRVPRLTGHFSGTGDLFTGALAALLCAAPAGAFSAHVARATEFVWRATDRLASGGAVTLRDAV